MTKNLRILPFALLPLFLSACGVFESKSSHKNGPPKGSVDRRYDKSPDEISRAVNEALQELQMSVQSDEHDALGGVISAQRNTPKKEDVTVWTKRLDARSTEVTVGVGVGDRTLAELIHQQIAQKLGSSSARAMPGVGATAEGQYDQTVETCTKAAEQAMKDMKLSVTGRETHDTWAQVSSRDLDAIPVEIKMERTEKDKTRVSFSAGTSRSQDTQQLVDRVKAEFERTLNQAK